MDDDDDESDSSEDETEDENGYLHTEEIDKAFRETLKAIKNKEPWIYDGKTTLYPQIDEEAAKAAAKAARAREKKEKPMYLTDYHRENLLRVAAGEVDPEMEDDVPKQKTYAEEQAAVLNEFKATLDASDGEDGDDDFFKAKEAPAQSLTKDGMHPSRAARPKFTEEEIMNADKDPDAFLEKYIATKAWIFDDDDKPDAFESDEGEQGFDADLYEHGFNMRFEDPEKSNEILRSYARDVAAARSSRKEKSGRAKRRELERQQREQAKQERREERARLKQLRVAEMAEKIKKIKRAAGIKDRALNEEEWSKLLSGAWDNEKWEEEMRKQFGEAYYAEVEEVSSSDEDGKEKVKGKSKKKRKPKKPKWDDDIDINDIVPDFGAEDAVPPNIKLTDDEGGDEDEDEDDNPTKVKMSAKEAKKAKLKAKRVAEQERAQIEAFVTTQMELDDPTILADRSAGPSKDTVDATSELPPFRYRETSPQSFGLTARDILLAPSDAALNTFAGLKKLAPFRDDAKKRVDRKRLGKKARLRKWRRETFGPDYERTGPTYGFEEAAAAAAALAAKREDKKKKDGDEKTKGKRKRKRGSDDTAEKDSKKRKTKEDTGSPDGPKKAREDGPSAADALDDAAAKLEKKRRKRQRQREAKEAKAAETAAEN